MDFKFGSTTLALFRHMKPVDIFLRIGIDPIEHCSNIALNYNLSLYCLFGTDSVAIIAKSPYYVCRIINIAITL